MQVSEAITTYLRDEVLDGRTDVELTPTTHLVEEEIIDSLGIFRLVSFLEDHFGLEIDPEDVTFDNFTTITTIEAFVQAKQATEAPQP
jgi:acyl carrier protein